jgi:hypothetical protein
MWQGTYTKRMGTTSFFSPSATSILAQLDDLYNPRQRSVSIHPWKYGFIEVQLVAQPEIYNK